MLNYSVLQAQCYRFKFLYNFDAFIGTLLKISFKPKGRLGRFKVAEQMIGKGINSLMVIGNVLVSLSGCQIASSSSPFTGVKPAQEQAREASGLRAPTRFRRSTDSDETTGKASAFEVHLFSCSSPFPRFCLKAGCGQSPALDCLDYLPPPTPRPPASVFLASSSQPQLGPSPKTKQPSGADGLSDPHSCIPAQLISARGCQTWPGSARFSLPEGRGGEGRPALGCSFAFFSSSAFLGCSGH